MDRTPTLRIGETLDRFVITDVLPAGGMGEVYRARDTELQRDVAIKLLLRAEGHDLERFVREARIAAGFSHPNLMSIFDVRTQHRGEQTLPYLVMEFIEGQTLGDRMRTAGQDQVIRWLSEVADGLHALHECGVVHRDLKPANIMIGTTDNRARIIDFGLAKTNGSTVTTTGTIVGTVDYFSPEQANQETVDFRTDIFSFGIVLYEALTGRHPFRRPTNLHTMHAIHAESPGPMPSRGGAIVARCLEKIPTNRYDDAADIAHQLRELQPAPRPNTPATTSAPTVDHDARTVEITSHQPSPLGRRLRLVTLITTLVLTGAIAMYQQQRLPDTAPASRAANLPPLVAAQHALPSCGLTASPGTITFGGSAKLNWLSSNVVDAVISPAIGIVSPNGSVDVSPRITATYHLVVTSAEGSVTESSVTLLVTDTPTAFKANLVSGSIIASPAIISRKGDVAILAWNSFEATHVVITPSIGIVPLQGRIQVEPRTTTTYTMTISNEAGRSGHGSAIVYVEHAGAEPAVAVANPEIIVECVAATQRGVSGPLAMDSSSCSVPPHRTVTHATLSYILDDGGTVMINGRGVFTKTSGVGAREGTFTLPVELFPSSKSFLLSVEARNAGNLGGTRAGEVYGNAVVHLITRDAMAGLEIKVSPGVIRQGEAAELSWSSSDAPTVALNPLVGTVAPNGRMAVSPTHTTTYSLRGWSASGDPATAHVTLEVQ